MNGVAPPTPIKSALATVRHPTKVTNGSAAAPLAWPWPASSYSRARPLPGGQRTHHVALVRAGATFNSHLVQRPEEPAAA